MSTGKVWIAFFLMVKEGRKRESDGEGEEVSLLTSFLCLTDCVVSESKKLYSSEFVFSDHKRDGTEKKLTYFICQH